MTTNGDPFLPALLILAMKERKRLIIEGDVSSALLAATRHIMGLYSEWSAKIDESFASIGIDASAIPRTHRGSAAGAFFSCGVDSFYTHLRNLSRYPTGDPRLISHLILVEGFDISPERATLFETVRQNSSIVAQALGKTLVPVRTNAKSVVRGVAWEYSHGAILASVGLALGGLFHTAYIPATDAFPDELIPWGSHPGLDPLWSTEQLEFVHHGAEVRRADKIRFISSSPLALRFLRVCWKNLDGAYNCGRCEKCLQTMVDLELCGALERAERFPKKIKPEDLEHLLIPRNELDYWRYTLRLARDGTTDEGLLAAIEGVVARRMRADRRLRWTSGTWHLLSRLGLTRERMKAVDRVLFRGKRGHVARPHSAATGEEYRSEPGAMECTENERDSRWKSNATFHN